MKRFASILVIVASCLAPAIVHGDVDVLRESTGQRRTQLDGMELQPFPAVWDSLTVWANGEPIKPADLSGKPALVVNWASWNPGSVRALALSQKMADQFGPQGLVVVGIHHPQGWDAAEKTAKEKGVKFPIAHDKDGAYRKALKIDHEPEYFIIDRAGHLRYASVVAGSVDEALSEVVKETAEAAGDVPKIRKDREEQTRLAGRRTTDIRGDFDLSMLPPVPPGYSPPLEKDYKDVKWPKMEKELGKAFGLLDNDEKPIEAKLAFTPVAWSPKKPETMGRVQVIYFWHPSPELHLTYSPVMEKMDQLQEQHLRDVTVIGALIGSKVIKGSSGSTTPGEEEETLDKLKKKWESFIASRQYSHALAADVGATCLSTLNHQTSNKFPVPGAMIVSTDGTIRWIGFTMDRSGRWDPDFRAALDNVVAKDPGIQKRRKLDREWIDAHKK